MNNILILSGARPGNIADNGSVRLVYNVDRELRKNLKDNNISIRWCNEDEDANDIIKTIESSVAVLIIKQPESITNELLCLEHIAKLTNKLIYDISSFIDVKLVINKLNDDLKCYSINKAKEGSDNKKFNQLFIFNDSVDVARSKSINTIKDSIHNNFFKCGKEILGNAGYSYDNLKDIIERSDVVMIFLRDMYYIHHKLTFDYIYKNTINYNKKLVIVNTGMSMIWVDYNKMYKDIKNALGSDEQIHWITPHGDIAKLVYDEMQYMIKEEADNPTVMTEDKTVCTEGIHKFVESVNKIREGIDNPFVITTDGKVDIEEPSDSICNFADEYDENRILIIDDAPVPNDVDSKIIDECCEQIAGFIRLYNKGHVTSHMSYKNVCERYIRNSGKIVIIHTNYENCIKIWDKITSNMHEGAKIVGVDCIKYGYKNITNAISDEITKKDNKIKKALNTIYGTRAFDSEKQKEAYVEFANMMCIRREVLPKLCFEEVKYNEK